jgi:hypothetical protein
VTVFYNEGEIDSGGSSFTWVNAGKAWRGPGGIEDRGTNYWFGNINGLGRADLIDVNPQVNSVRIPLLRVLARPISNA